MDKTVIVGIVVFFLVLLPGAHHFYLNLEEPDMVTVSFDERWKIGSSEIEIGSNNEEIIPLLKFEYNGRKYTTYPDDDHDLSVKSVEPVIVPMSAILNGTGNDDAVNFQKFFIASHSSFWATNSRPTAIYVILDEKDVYYAVEGVYNTLWVHDAVTICPYGIESEKDKRGMVSHQFNVDWIGFISILWIILGGFCGFVGYKFANRIIRH